MDDVFNLEPMASTKEKKQALSETFWQNVNIKLKEQKKTKEWLGQQTGIATQSISSAIYHKSTVNVYTALRICAALNCSVEDMLYGTSPDIAEMQENIESSLVQQAEEEGGSSQIVATSKLFQRLKKEEQKAILVHLFSLLGMNPKTTLCKIDAGGVQQ